MSKPPGKRPNTGRRKKKSSTDIINNLDNDKVDEYQQSTWTNSASSTSPNVVSVTKIDSPTRPRSHEFEDEMKNKSKAELKELKLHRQISNRSKKRHIKTKKKHTKSNSALSNIANSAKNKWWKPRTSDPVKEEQNKNKNIIIKINHIDKNKKQKQKHKKQKQTKKRNVIFDIESEQQILGDILIHRISWNQLMMIKNNNNNNNDKVLGWKKIYSVLNRATLCFWDKVSEEEENNKDRPSITIYLSEILTLNKSIRSIDNCKYIIELNVCGCSVLLSFNNIEQREYWHSLLSDYHLNYFVWRSTPLDEKKRSSQNVINGVYKLLKSKNNNNTELINDNIDTINILYIEEILQKISSLNINSHINIVPFECKFQCLRLIRVIMSIKFFFMSVLKSLSGADIALPSRDLLIQYLDEIVDIEWSECNNQILDFYCDKCYRIMFNLSFAFTSSARDEIMKLNEIIEYKKDDNNNNRRIAEMKFEYESLQRSWKMHRDRLQEYVMAYRDAVAKLKHSYHQRDSLCKKIEILQKENKKLIKENKTHQKTIDKAHKLTQTLDQFINNNPQQMRQISQQITNLLNNNNNNDNDNKYTWI